ncbi:MAG TPA: thioesterase [Thermoanaerobaculia bacterium]
MTPAGAPARPEPEVGATASAELVVSEGDLASALGIGPPPFPPVFATARMVALMEVAAARVLAPFLNPGELSVGVRIDATHSAATAPGVTVTATARYLGREGGLYAFEVVVHDRGGEVGRGAHRRAIVSNDRLVAGAVRRNGATAP